MAATFLYREKAGKATSWIYLGDLVRLQFAGPRRGRAQNYVPLDSESPLGFMGNSSGRIGELQPLKLIKFSRKSDSKAKKEFLLWKI